MTRTVWISSFDVSDGPLDVAIKEALTDEELSAFNEFGDVPEDVEVKVSIDWLGN
jgi:hypothetical protein